MITDHQRLALIQESIESIEKQASQGKNAFEEEDEIQATIFENLREIAVASSSFTPKIKERYPDIDWAKISGMHSFLEVQRSGIDPEIIWLSVEQDIPAIKDEIRTIIQSVETMP
jgi:uncharacterized protein with HEPN domain